MLTSDVLRAAKGRIQRVGWQSGTGRVEGATCAANAIFHVGGEELTHYDPAQQLFAKVAVGGVWGAGPSDHLDAIWRWNDAPERTLQDILNAFDAAIARAEQDEAAASISTPDHPGAIRVAPAV